MTTGKVKTEYSWTNIKVVHSHIIKGRVYGIGEKLSLHHHDYQDIVKLIEGFFGKLEPCSEFAEWWPIELVPAIPHHFGFCNAFQIAYSLSEGPVALILRREAYYA